MRLFYNSLSSLTGSIPIGLSYVGYRTTSSGCTRSGHIQGITIDLQNDRCYISWTGGVCQYKWSDLSFINESGNISGLTHIGDISYYNGYIYCPDGFKSQDSPTSNQMIELNANDLSVNRNIQSSLQWSAGALAWDGSKMWIGYGSNSLSDGKIQELDLTTLNAVGDIITIPTTTTGNSDFGSGIQAISFFNSEYLISCDYWKGTCNQGFDASNIKIINFNNLSYTRPSLTDFMQPWQYGCCVVGNKLYVIQEPGATGCQLLDTKTVEIHEYNILTV